MRWRRRIRVIDDCFIIKRMERKDLGKEEQEKKHGGAERGEEEEKERVRKRERNEKTLCGHHAPPPSPAIGFTSGLGFKVQKNKYAGPLD